MNNRSAYIKRTGTSSDMHIYILELWITSLEIFQQTWRVICYLAAHDISHKDYCLKISVITFQDKFYKVTWNSMYSLKYNNFHNFFILFCNMWLGIVDGLSDFQIYFVLQNVFFFQTDIMIKSFSCNKTFQ